VNALRLKRTATRIFSPKADIAPRLLTTLKPALHLTLYPALRSIATKPGPSKVYALRSTVSLFGHNARKEPQYEPATIIANNETVRNPNAGNLKSWDTWSEWKPADDEAAGVVFLDNAYEKIMLGSYIIVQKPGALPPQIFGNIEVITRPRTAYGLSAKTTEITLPDGETWWDPNYETTDDFKFIRGTVVYAQSELLDLADEPIEMDVQGATVEINGLYDGLESGRWLILSGERTDVPGTSEVKASERVMLAGITQAVQQVELPDGTMEDLPGDKLHSTLILTNSLAYAYKRDTVTVYGNVVKATHGETREEILGSGDGSKELQSFTLSQSPLTHLAAATPAGAKSTLEVRVNDVRWHEAGNLFKLGPNDRGYVTRTDNEDKASIVFGDGQHGARLPTGPENVKAVYRFGMGKTGNVAAEQISMLATKPLGVKGVINPLPAMGGAGRETRDQARRNAPLAVMALDRLVSIQDYADFARIYAGIGKASAARLSGGRRQVVHVTIAGADDIPIDTNSDLYSYLCQALHIHGDPYQPIQVDVREIMLLVISAKVRLLPDYQWESVEPQIRAALLETFSFDRRELGQDVLLSEVISVIQRVVGVAYVDVDIMDSVSETITPEELAKLAETLQSEDQPKERIVVNMARSEEKVTYHTVQSLDTLWSLAEHYSTTVKALVRLNNIADPDLIRIGESLLIRREGIIEPAQLAYLSPDVTDTLLLQELTS
jgi:predicted phage baseplate assembly protein